MVDGGQGSVGNDLTSLDGVRLPESLHCLVVDWQVLGLDVPPDRVLGQPGAGWEPIEDRPVRDALHHEPLDLTAVWTRACLAMGHGPQG